VPFVRKIKWGKLWSYAVSWCRKPANFAMLIWLAFVASHTTTIQLGTNVVIVPEHQPAVLGKSVATLDALSGERGNSAWRRGARPRSTAP
jgi:alkanesulfonate monooxygenase SsuD/methylene tetrahydromethanopterin reductase-like flavin-dependent oxidoreductase (luciferase family)